MTLTIRTIAEMAQVSCTTVSRVLNNKADVKPETREKILALVEKSGFQPNAFARGIQSNKSRCVGLIIPHKMAYILSDNFYTQIILGLSDGLLERNYFLLVCNTENIQDIIKIYRQKRADGFVFIRLGEDDLPIVETLDTMSIPFISTAKLSGMQKMVHVDIDNYAASCQAMEYLISLGHRDIGMIVESNTLSCSKERFQAYRDTMRKHGFTVNEKIVAYGASNMRGGYAAMQSVLQGGEKMTAVFVDGDELAIGAMKAVRESGKKVPDDISIVGFDGIGASEYSDPPLTTVQQPVYEKGVMAARLLIDKLENDKEISSVDLVAKLIVRASAKARSDVTKDRINPMEGKNE